jgi:hypothetical protein
VSRPNAQGTFRNTGPAESACASDVCHYPSVKLSDRIKRWWSPAKWRDEHPEVSDGDDFAIDAKQSVTDRRAAEAERFRKDDVR